MKLNTTITYSHDPADEPKRMDSAVRSGLQTALVHWRREFAREHFEPGAVTRYGYQSRTKLYMLRKAKAKKHQKPLVWSGTLRQMVLGQFPQPRVSRDGGKQTGSMVLKVPGYTFYTKTKSGTPAPPKYDELVTTNSHEAGIMQAIIAETIDRMMSRVGLKKKVG